MTPKDLDTRFEEALAIADEMTQASLPQDVQLRLYAYYKQATFGNLTSGCWPVCSSGCCGFSGSLGSLLPPQPANNNRLKARISNMHKVFLSFFIPRAPPK